MSEYEYEVMTGQEAEKSGLPVFYCYSRESALVIAQDFEVTNGRDWSDDREVFPAGRKHIWAYGIVRRPVKPPTPTSSPPAGLRTEGALTDLKEGLSSNRKADTTHIRTPLLVYGARACEYGSAKYERANYLRPVGSTAGDFNRLRAYLRAAQSHITQVLDSMEMHQSQDPNLTDEAGMKRSAYCEDTDTKPGDKVGPSGLPHLCGAVASLMMGITQATTYGLLPADPGTPWVKEGK